MSSLEAYKSGLKVKHYTYREKILLEHIRELKDSISTLESKNSTLENCLTEERFRPPNIGGSGYEETLQDFQNLSPNTLDV